MYKYFKLKMSLMRALLGFWGMFVALVILSVFGKSAILASEAFHAFLDALVVSLSLHAIKSINKISSEYTYGMHRLEILYSLLNILVVIVGTIIGVIVSALFLIFNVVDDPKVVVITSVIVTLAGLIAATEEEKGEEIRKSVRFHAILDVIAYIIGFIFGVAILFTNYSILDPIGSLVILVVIVITSLSQIKTYIDVLMEKSPIDTKEIEDTLKQVYPTVHHIHVWTICPHIKVATLHISESPDMRLERMEKERKEIERILSEKYGINHVTIQFETKKID